MTVEQEIRRRISKKVATNFGGNRKRTMRDVAVDLINASKEDWKDIADGCYLAKSTVANLAKDKTQFPRYDTIERVFKYFQYEARLGKVTVKSQYDNQPKTARK